MQRGRSAEGESRSRFEIDFVGQSDHASTRLHALELSVTPHFGTGESDDPVASLEVAHLLPDGLHLTRHLRPQNQLPGLGEPEDQPADQPKTGRHFQAANPPIAGGDRCRPDADQNLPGGGRQLRHFEYLEDFR